jgi:hypothetical protein
MECCIADIYPVEDPGFVQHFFVDETPREGGVACEQFADTRKVVINYGGKEGVHICWSPRGDADELMMPNGFDMSGNQLAAQPAVRCPFDGQAKQPIDQ